MSDRTLNGAFHKPLQWLSVVKCLDLSAEALGMGVDFGVVKDARDMLHDEVVARQIFHHQRSADAEVFH